MDALEARVSSLLSEIRRAAAGDFTGLGLVFYRPPLRLPSHPLGDPAMFRPHLPLAGDLRIAQVLAGISRTGSPWHDGFHLIDCSAFALTQVCQFLSPPLALLDPPEPDQYPVGARWRAAAAISRMPEVALSALIGRQGNAAIFRQGLQVLQHERPGAKSDGDGEGV
ncbi:hypothetical protein [Massilia endophytica]|uniref:hypothetical protein n=1 Tax=Massilia endophytica TaxID=2899220 RepID=UPI001E450F13|nr:hypothetical protein [Massilia endophytica]UGQ45659.1 hypothetical protein LSQ66_17980 [Massilia endophytica]